MNTRPYRTNKGVSETVGFIIIFGIVMAGIGLVSLYGYPTLLNQQREANIKNMEKTMIVLQTDLNSLAFKNVPYQETSVQVAGGTLSIQKDPPPFAYFKFEFPPVGSSSQYTTGKLRFVSDDGGVTICLENGAVVKRYNSISGSVMISKPRWFYDPTTKTMVIPIITLNATQDFSQTGIGTIAMRLTDSQESTPYPVHPNENSMKISYFNDFNKDDYYRAWEQYLTDTGFPFQVENANAPFDMTYNFGKDPVNLPVEYLVIKNYNVTFVSL
jgi:hypothetical protein